MLIDNHLNPDKSLFIAYDEAVSRRRITAEEMQCLAFTLDSIRKQVLESERENYLESRKNVLENSVDIVLESKIPGVLRRLIDHHLELTINHPHRFTPADDPDFLRRRIKRRVQNKRPEIPPQNATCLKVEDLWKITKEGSLIHITNDPSLPAQKLKDDDLSFDTTDWEISIAERLDLSPGQVHKVFHHRISGPEANPALECGIDLADVGYS